ncbi:hypothetical protein VPH35_004300 [Triticum aestivum]
MEEYGEVYCSVEKWCTLVSQLNARQRTRLRGTSLQNFLQIPSVQMRKCLLKYMLRPTKGGISLRTDDVFHIFGLVNKGKDVMKALGKMDEYVKEMVPSKFVDARSGEIVIDQLINNIVSSGTYDDDFVRRAVLVLIGTIIAPHSTRHVPHFLYQLVEDVEAIKSYNWNAFTLRVYIEGITKTVKDVKKFKWPVGNLALIQYMYWEKVQPTSVETFDPLLSEYPLMVNWSEMEAKKRDIYDNENDRGHGTIDDLISEQYRHARIAKEAIIEEEDTEPPSPKGGGRTRKGCKPTASSSRGGTKEHFMKCIRDMQKEIRLIPEKCAEILLNKLSKKGLLVKRSWDFRDDRAFEDESDELVRKYKPKYHTEVTSSPLEEREEEEMDASFTGPNGTNFPNDEGMPSTPGKGVENDPFIIEDNGSPKEASPSLGTNDFPSLTRNPQKENAVSVGSSAENSAEGTYPSPATICKDAINNGTEEHDGKRKRQQSKYCRSPFIIEDGPRKRVKKSLFRIRDVLLSTDFMDENHIEGARVYIDTLADSPKHCKQTVVHMTGIGGETCTAEMLQAITSGDWLNGAVINCYSNHLLTTTPMADRHVLTSWVSYCLIQHAKGKLKNSNMNYMEFFTKESKTVSKVIDEYFAKDKAFSPPNVNKNHWITIVMHTKKKEFQVLNSTGKISKAVHAKIALMRAEIAVDTNQVNSAIGTHHPDVSKWPIKEYKMPRQSDGVSCGLFVMKCIELWDGDAFRHDFDQDEINSSRGRILVEILFSESNTLTKVKEKILKIMEKE